jgi:hypothetical protein
VVHHRDQVEADCLGALGKARDVLEERLRRDPGKRVVGKVVPEQRTHQQAS